jgi:dienelactone hydrolase
MSRFLIVGSALLVGALVLPPASGQEKKDDKGAELAQKAKDFIDLVGKGDYDKATAGFDATMRKVMPADKLQETWKSLTDQHGAFLKQQGTRAQHAGKYELIFVRCVFAKTTLEARVVFDGEQKIAGLFFAPPPVDYQAPAYVHRDRFRETPVKIGAGEWELPGTLTLPVGEGPFPAVVLVHGSGPQDRDETIGPNMPFRDLAWGLASEGIAVLRYEKRTKVYPAKLAAVRDTLTVKEEVLDDALAAVALLRKTEKIDSRRIFVLGHSLGAILAPKMAAEEPAIAGIFCLAGSTRPLEEVIVEQLDYVLSVEKDMPPEQRKQAEKMRELAAGMKDLKLTRDTPSSRLPLGMSAAYFLSLRENDPLEVVKQVKQPVIVLQGERDYQVTMQDFQGWQKALSGRANATFKTYPKLNHLFMEGEGKAKPAEYGKTGHVSREVIDDLAGWVKKR